MSSPPDSPVKRYWVNPKELDDSKTPWKGDEKRVVLALDYDKLKEAARELRRLVHIPSDERGPEDILSRTRWLEDL